VRQITIMKGKPSIRRTMLIPGMFVGLLAVAALAASAAPAEAVSQQKLEKAGWFCIAPLHVTHEQHCFGPKGFDRLTDPSSEAKAVKALVFDGQEFLGVEVNIHDDVFNGQPCPTDPPRYEYTYLNTPELFPGLNYWACHRFDSDHL
jgi:hypothetical protein